MLKADSQKKMRLRVCAYSEGISLYSCRGASL